jgi:RNA polymerase sigma-70 factor (ECF subfamily)
MKTEQTSTDTKLIEQYKSGDASVLPILVRRWHKIFCEKAYWVTKNKETAKDIAQDSWLTIMAKIHTLNDVASFRGWAFRIVYCKAIDAINAQNKANRQLHAMSPVEIDTESKVDNAAFIQKVILRAIQQLPADKQMIIRLFYTDSYSVKEISELLDVPLGTVKSRLFKAREKLKTILKDVNYEK